MKSTFLAAVLLGFVPAVAHAGTASDADASLNATYTALMAQLDAADQVRLRDAQRAWIAFRDKDCSFRAQGGNGGSASAMASSNCIAELTRERSAALKRVLDCPQGDVTCVPRKPAVADATAAGAGTASCNATAGTKKAALYADQCIQVSPATHPPCNGENACDLIIDEIKRGCAMIGKDAPAFCAGYAAGP